MSTATITKQFFQDNFPDAISAPDTGFMALGADSLDLERWALDLAKCLQEDADVSAMTFTEYPTYNELLEYLVEELQDEEEANEEDDVPRGVGEESDDEAEASTSTNMLAETQQLPDHQQHHAELADSSSKSVIFKVLHDFFSKELPVALKQPDVPFTELCGGETQLPFARWALGLGRSLQESSLCLPVHTDVLDDVVIRKCATLNQLEQHLERLMGITDTRRTLAPAGSDDHHNSERLEGAAMREAVQRRGVTITPVVLAFVDCGVLDYICRNEWSTLQMVQSTRSGFCIPHGVLHAGMHIMMSLGWMDTRSGPGGEAQYRLTESFPYDDMFGKGAALGAHTVEATFFRAKYAEMLLAYALLLSSIDDARLDWASKLASDMGTVFRCLDNSVVKDKRVCRPIAGNQLEDFDMVKHMRQIRNPILRELMLGGVVVPLLVTLKAACKCCASETHINDTTFATMLPMAAPDALAVQTMRRFLEDADASVSSASSTARALLEETGILAPRVKFGSDASPTIFTVEGKVSWCRAFHACSAVANLPQILRRCFLVPPGSKLLNATSRNTPLHKLAYHMKYSCFLKAFGHHHCGGVDEIQDRRYHMRSAIVQDEDHTAPMNLLQLRASDLRTFAMEEDCGSLALPWLTRACSKPGMFALGDDGATFDPLEMGRGLVAMMRRAARDTADEVRALPVFVAIAHQLGIVAHEDDDDDNDKPRRVYAPSVYDEALHGSLLMDAHTFYSCAMMAGLFPRGLHADVYPLPTSLFSPRPTAHVSMTRLVTHNGIALRILRPDDTVLVEVTPQHHIAARRFLPDFPQDVTDSAFMTRAPVLSVARFWEHIHWGKDEMCTPEETVRLRYSNHPSGQYGLVDTQTGELLAMLFTQRINTPSTYLRDFPNQAKWATKETFHVAGGRYVQLLDIFSAKSGGRVVRDEKTSGVGSYLRYVAKMLLGMSPDCEGVYAVTRGRDYYRKAAAEGVSYADYVRQVASGKIRDTGINFHTDGGAKVVREVPDWRAADEVNDGFGVLIKYTK